MDRRLDARREAALELQELVEEFERSDAAALRRTRLACWAVVAIMTLVVLLLLLAGADWRYLAAFWGAVVGVAWGAYGVSSYRQRDQTERLKALATRWLTEEHRS